MTDRCPYVSEERGADGHHTCSASRLSDGTHRRCAYKCTVAEASLCLDYQRARADAAEGEVIRLKLQRRRSIKRTEYQELVEIADDGSLRPVEAQ